LRRVSARRRFAPASISRLRVAKKENGLSRGRRGRMGASYGDARGMTGTITER
jgi:hypothetical protein